MKARAQQDLLVSALLHPAGVTALRLDQWNALLQLAARYGLLARLATELANQGLLGRIPAKARSHLRAGRIAAESSQTSVRFEINRVLRALAGLDTPVILLKGAAYLMAELPPARGRSVGDLDLMVPREKIDQVEGLLVAKGWAPADLDDYDQRYYREWSHEIPPLQHPQRQTPLDIHHTIAPLTSRVRPDADALLAGSVPLADPRLRVLGPADMVLHSAVHLFNDEVGKPLRDLFDLRDLLGHFGAREGFWTELIDRARLHGLGRPLYYTLRYTGRLLDVRIPPEIASSSAAWAPNALLRALMDWLFTQYFVPEPPEQPRRAASLARGVLYLHSHWLRMPPLLLVRHLSIKAAQRFRERFERNANEEENV